jgi:hypothetical protein
LVLLHDVPSIGQSVVKSGFKVRQFHTFIVAEGTKSVRHVEVVERHGGLLHAPR